MSSKTDLRAYFKRRATGSDGPAAKKKNRNPEIIASATEHVSRAEVEIVTDEVERSNARQKYNNIPKHILMEVGKYAFAHNTKDALAEFSKQYPNYKFKRTSINSWKASFKNNENSQNLKKTGRPNLLFEELLNRAKDVTIDSSLARTVISRYRNRKVVAIGTGVVKANDPGTIVQIYFVSERQAPRHPFCFLNTLYVVNNYTDYRNFSIISGAKF